MKKLLTLLTMALIVISANAQAIIAEIDWTQKSEWDGSWYSKDYAEVSVEQGTGLIINCTSDGTTNYWEPQVPIISHIDEIDEGGQYQVKIQFTSPVAGKLRLDFYSWDGSGATMAQVFEVAEGDNDLTIDFLDYPTPCTDAGIFYHCGKLPGKHIIKKVQVIDLEGEAGDGPIFYNYVSKGKIAEVKRISNTNREIVIPSTVTHEGETYTVTKIGNKAFSGRKNLTSVTIPNTVTSIGESAFEGCSGLTSVTIPNSVTTIGGSAFSGCSKLSSIAIPKSITNINSYTFMGCSSLTSVNIPNNITTIGNSAFNGCSGLTSINIPNSVTTIGESAFSSCSKLSSIAIPKSVSIINNHTFSGCSSLASVNIPTSVTSIGYSAFYNCKGLTTVTIPNSVTSIGSNAFQNCTGLTSVNIPSSVTSLSAFSGCTGLTSITIPNSVTSINSYAFQGCTGLTSVTIPNSVSWINDYAFQGCSNLKSVTIGNSVNIIESRAFANCSALTDVYCLAENVPWTNTDAFNESYIDYATLHVPAASLNNYKNTEPWKNFQNKVALDSGDIPETPKCAKPEISFENGRVKFTCETEGVEYISDVVLADQHKYYDAEIQLSQTYKVSVYATKAGYDNSDVTTREIVITGNGKAIVVGDVDGDGKVNVADHVKLSEIIMNK